MKFNTKLSDGIPSGCLCQLIYGQFQLLRDLIRNEGGGQRISLKGSHRDTKNTSQIQEGDVRVGLEQLAVAFAAQHLQDNVLQDILTAHFRQDWECLEITKSLLKDGRNGVGRVRSGNIIRHIAQAHHGNIGAARQLEGDARQRLIALIVFGAVKINAFSEHVLKHGDDFLRQLFRVHFDHDNPPC